MLTKLKALLTLMTTIIIATGCATIERPDVQAINVQPNVSTSKLSAEINKSAPKSSLKRKVAIGRFSNETHYGQSFFIDKNQDRIGKQALDILSNKLNETNKFILIERADLDKIQRELDIAKKSAINNSVDYLVVGSVTEFGRKETGEVGVFSRTKKQLAFAKVHIRLVEVASGRIIFSEEGTGEAYSEAGTVMGVGGRAGYDSTINDKALDAAITNLAGNIIENLLAKPWRSFILDRERDVYIIAGGKTQGIKYGELFDVVEKGRQVNNPQTNTIITIPGKKIARLRALSFAGDNHDNEVTFCELISGTLGEDLSHFYIEEAK